VHVDFGTGDGGFVQRLARRAQDTLVIGVDASADGLRDVARRLAARPARGGLANAMLGVLALEQAPGELVGLADHLTVLLPWGTLLRAVAGPDLAALARLRAVCKPGAGLRVVFGLGDADAASARGLDPRAWPALPGRYRDAGFAVTAAELPLDEVRALGTTWAGKLAFSGRARTFVELRGRAVDP
jgi:16S rRNA (adenine(1408)-N(1))-methyltransferase